MKLRILGFILVIMCFAQTVPASAQNTINAKPKNQTIATRYDGKKLDVNKMTSPCGYDNGLSQEIIVKPARNEYINLVDKICENLRTENVYIVVEAPISNAAAVIYEGFHFIIIDHDFVEDIRMNTGTDFCLIGILAHEIGHHLSGHTSENLSQHDRPYAELEADHYAGKALSSSSAETLDDYYGVIEYLVPFEDHPANVRNGYPGNLERKNAIFSGAINKSYFPPSSYKFELPLEDEITRIEKEIVNYLTSNKLDTNWALESYSIKNKELIVTNDMGDDYPKDIWKSRYNYTIIKIEAIEQINFQPFEGCCIDFITKAEGIRYSGRKLEKDNLKPSTRDHILTETMWSDSGADKVLSTINDLFSKLMYLYSIE